MIVFLGRDSGDLAMPAEVTETCVRWITTCPSLLYGVGRRFASADNNQIGSISLGAGPPGVGSDVLRGAGCGCHRSACGCRRRGRC